MTSCVQIPRAIGAFYHVWKWLNVQQARSEMRCCTTMLSTDPSYDNRTNASTLKMQIWIATNNSDVSRVMKTKFPATVMVFVVVWSEGLIIPSHIFEVGLKVNTKVYLDVLKSVVIPWCNQVAGGRSWVWQQDSAPVHKSKETEAWFQECYDLYPSLTAPPLPPTWTRWTTSFGHTSRISRTWPPTTPKPAWSPPSTELPPALVEKACSQFRIRISRRWLRLKAAILNRCQLYYIIKLAELIFSMKVLK